MFRIQQISRRLVRRHLLKWIAAGVLVFSPSLAVRGSSSLTDDYLIDLWTGDDGLPDSSVTAIAQTPDGYLWIGTHNGLARFDGVRFVNFDPFNTPELKHARVDALFVDAHGTLWINTRDGSMTAWRTGTFSHEWEGGQVSAVFSRPNQVFFAALRGELFWRDSNQAGRQAWKAIALAGTATGSFFRQDDQGVLWYLTRDGTIERIVGTNSQPVSSQEYLNGERGNYLASDRQGRIWVGTEKRLLRWQGDRFEDLTPTNGEPVVNATFIACAGSNGCWVVANNKVRKAVDRRWVAEAEAWQDLIQADPTYLGTHEDATGGVWIRHFGRGLFHARGEGGTQRISTADGLPGNRAGCWFQDREGNVWVGVDRGGLVRLRAKKFQVIGTGEGLPIPATSSVCEDVLGNIWIGTFGGGLNRWQDGKLTRFELSEGANRSSFFSAYPDDSGRLWLSAGREDLFVLDTNRIAPAPTVVHGIKAMLVDRQGQLWMGRQNGLTRLADAVVTNFGPGNGFERTDVRALAEDREGNLWIGAGSGVLYRFADGTFTAFPMNDSLTNQAIWSLLPDTDGSLWVGTFRGGLLRFKDGRFTRYTIASGLPSDIICQILDDGLGKLWIGSRKGIFYLPKNSLKDFDAGKIASLPCVAYGLYDGLPTLECSGNYQPSCWRGRDGRLWFATVKGLVSVQPGEVPVNQLPPPVVIEEVFVDGKVQSADISGPTGTRKGKPAAPVQIPPGEHQLDFEYTALSFAAPDKVRFRYRLEGLDQGWVEAEGKRSAHYGPLRPGDYRFQVIACNNDGIWNETGATIALKVLPHFWETWWFKCAAGLLLGGAVVGAVRFAVTRNLRRKLEQLKQQRAIERERERIARDIHDDLGAGLTQIMLQSALARRSASDQTPAHLAQISETAHELVGAMDEIVWAINPENDTLEELVTYVGQFFQEYATLAGLRCRLELPAQPPAFVLSAEMRHNLFLAVKEALHNAVKHAAATEVSLELKTQPTGFSFVIADNGRGFVSGADKTPTVASDRISSGHGLHNLSDRMEKIGGTCAIQSRTGEGTVVELTVMLERAGARQPQHIRESFMEDASQAGQGIANK